MIKKLRRRFVFLSTGIIFIILFSLLLLNSAFSYSIMSKSQVDLSNRIFEKVIENKLNPFEFDRPFKGPDDLMRTRFIVFEINDDEPKIIKNSFMAFLNDDELINISNTIISKNKESGFFEDFSYSIYNTETSKYLILINMWEYKQSFSTIIQLQIGMSLIVLLLTFVLSNLMSKSAIKPFADNIEKQKRFITDASHELKTPVTSIVTSSEVLLMDDPNNEWLNNIQNQTKRLAKLINELVTLSSMDEEKTKLKKLNFSITDLSWEIIEPYKQLAKANNLNLKESIEENLTYKGDKNSISKLLNILLDNAIKYTNDNGDISFKAYKAKGDINIEVFNTCEYIDSISINHLFDRFYRTDESRNSKTGGTGLGLAIAKSIIEKNGASIKASTSNNKDILFKLTLK